MDQLFETQFPPPPTTGRYAQVALEQSIDVSPTGLTYAIPPNLADLAVGQRVQVPLGKANKAVSGYVVELCDTLALDAKTAARIKPILARDRQGLSLPADLIELARWMAGYYCCPLGMVLATMLPAAVKRGTGTVSQTWVGLAGPRAQGLGPREEALSRVPCPVSRVSEQAGNASADTEHGTRDAGQIRPPRLSKLQKTVLATLRERAQAGEAWVEIKRLADLAGARSVAPVRQLIDKELLVARQQSDVHAQWEESLRREEAPSGELVLTEAQRHAIDRLAKEIHEGFSVHLLHGVTGSGKTEVYLRAIEHVLGKRHEGTEARRHEGKDQKPQGQDTGHGTRDTGQLLPGVIVLVPEIALTPQTVARFLGRFDGVAVLHSGLTAAQRHHQWQRIRQDQARIVVGARSAVFAPLSRVGLIIVDEEHEPSYKQDQLPRYHARDVAIKRGQLAGAPVLLGSATPSLESYHNAQSRANFHLLRLPQRVAGLKLPAVQIVNLVAQRRQRPTGVHLLSLPLEDALRQNLAAGGQAILLLNRRGYANYIACPDQRCGWMLHCQYCDAAMVYHKDQLLPEGGLMRCHHCQAEQLLSRACPTCGRHVTVFGLGTQRVEEELAKKFPKASYLRMDSDAMRSGKDYAAALDQFRQGHVDVLVGTQMIAKGLDFSNVRLVGVISADTALNLPDFRAAERTFQLIAQVAGRAGRGQHPGLVIVQTFSPEDPVIGLAAKHDYEGFAKRELALRQSVGLPPFGRMARIVVRDRDHATGLAQARKLADHLAAANDQLKANVRLRGPAPCPIARIADYHRQQIELLSSGPGAAASIQRLLASLRAARLLRSDATTAVDVDPVAMM